MNREIEETIKQFNEFWGNDLEEIENLKFEIQEKDNKIEELERRIRDLEGYLDKIYYIAKNY